MTEETKTGWTAPSETAVSFSFRRHVGPRLVHGAVSLSFEAADDFGFTSMVDWPEDQLDEVVAEAVRTVLRDMGPRHEAMHVVLTAIEWDDVNSSPQGFERAARAATLAALRV